MLINKSNEILNGTSQIITELYLFYGSSHPIMYRKFCSCEYQEFFFPHRSSWRHHRNLEAQSKLVDLDISII